MTFYQGASCNLEIVVNEQGEEVVCMSNNYAAGIVPERFSAHRVDLDSLEAEPNPVDYGLGERPTRELAEEGVIDLAADRADVALPFGGGYSPELRALMNHSHAGKYRPSDTSGIPD